MNKKWAFVVVAAMFEVMWVIGLKHADDALTWAGTVIAIIVSFSMLIYAGGTTVVMATHNREIVDTAKRRVLEIDSGMVVRDEVAGRYGYEA